MVNLHRPGRWARRLRRWAPRAWPGSIIGLDLLDAEDVPVRRIQRVGHVDRVCRRLPLVSPRVDAADSHVRTLQGEMREEPAFRLGNGHGSIIAGETAAWPGVRGERASAERIRLTPCPSLSRTSTTPRPPNHPRPADNQNRARSGSSGRIRSLAQSRRRRAPRSARRSTASGLRIVSATSSSVSSSRP